MKDYLPHGCPDCGTVVVFKKWQWWTVVGAFLLIPAWTLFGWWAV
jgi:hypothetical protein